MDILPLGERRIIFSRLGLVRGEDGRPEVTRIHPNLFFAGAPCRLGGHCSAVASKPNVKLGSFWAGRSRRESLDGQRGFVRGARLDAAHCPEVS